MLVEYDEINYTNVKQDIKFMINHLCVFIKILLLKDEMTVNQRMIGMLLC